jgi:hypothetical protein
MLMAAKKYWEVLEGKKAACLSSQNNTIWKNVLERV